MSTVLNIKSDIEQLPPEKVKELAVWLQERTEMLESRESGSAPADSEESSPFFGFCKGIKLHDGWDGSLEDFKPYIE